MVVDKAVILAKKLEARADKWIVRLAALPASGPIIFLGPILIGIAGFYLGKLFCGG